MGSDPFLAQADHGAAFLELAATALAKDLRTFLADPSAPLPSAAVPSAAVPSAPLP
jgi:hypothetical protein